MVHRFQNQVLTMINGLKGKRQGQAEDKGKALETQSDDFAPTRPYEVIRLGQGYLKVESDLVLLQPGFLVGRGGSCHLTLADPNASRVHACFSQVNQSWFVEDNASKNGTLLNGKRIRRALLKKGDQIRIGQTLLIYEER